MEILGNISVGNIDEAGEIEVTIECGYMSHEHSSWIDKEQAIKLIAHLQGQFVI